MVAKFLDDNKPKIHFSKKQIRTVSNFTDLNSISFNVSNVGEIFWIEPEKDRHVQKSVMQMQSCCFFAVLVAVAVAVALAPFSCDQKILLPW